MSIESDNYIKGHNDCYNQLREHNKLIIWYYEQPRLKGMYLVNDGTCTFIAEWDGEQFEGVEGECKWMYLPE